MRNNTIGYVRVFGGYDGERSFGSGEEGIFINERSRIGSAEAGGSVFDVHLAS